MGGRPGGGPGGFFRITILCGCSIELERKNWNPIHYLSTFLYSFCLRILRGISGKLGVDSWGNSGIGISSIVTRCVSFTDSLNTENIFKKTYT